MATATGRRRARSVPERAGARGPPAERESTAQSVWRGERLVIGRETCLKFEPATPGSCRERSRPQVLPAPWAPWPMQPGAADNSPCSCFLFSALSDEAETVPEVVSGLARLRVGNCSCAVRPGGLRPGGIHCPQVPEPPFRGLRLGRGGGQTRTACQRRGVTATAAPAGNRLAGCFTKRASGQSLATHVKGREGG